MTTDYWPPVCALGTLDDEPHCAATALAALENGDIDPEGLHTALVQSKVVRLAVRRLAGRQLGPAGTKLLDLLLATDTEERARHAAAEAVTLPVLRLAAATDAAVIKGLALRSCYPDPAARHLGDIDVHTPDLATGLAFTTALRGQGWAWDLVEFPWLKWDEDGICYGQLPVVYPDSAAMITRVDLHFGAFSVGHAGRLPMVGWQRADVLGVDVRVPNRETAIALVAAHALGDTRLSMKDVNDLCVLIGDGVVDWSSVTELARTAHATDVLGQLLAEVGSAYPGRWCPTLRTGHRLRSGGL
ncbi:MAG TPA: nucleotidyltransferase family protein, partial [Pseudonocardiaceae bacterium]|nr:nucleotidyltransferase family protein [Pseudonocardiaceae bacterium]